MDCSPPGSSVHGIFQARVPERVAISFSMESSPPRDRTWVSLFAGRRFTTCATREALLPFKRVKSMSYSRRMLTETLNDKVYILNGEKNVCLCLLHRFLQDSKSEIFHSVEISPGKKKLVIFTSYPSGSPTGSRVTGFYILPLKGHLSPPTF